MFETSLKEYGFTMVVKFLVTLHGPSSTHHQPLVFSLGGSIRTFEKPDQRIAAWSTVEPQCNGVSFRVTSGFEEPEKGVHIG